MANKHRGEIEARLDGESWRLCLTLGALAELEQAFGDEDMLALAARFETGRISARDCVRIIGAGLRGAGHEVSDARVATMKADGGAAAFVAIVAALLNATFSAPGDTGGGRATVATDAVAGSAAGGERGPFPGPR
jgi:hypothetical protein